ncbi:SF1B family DNA helicase RecD2 [Streptococcus ovuberis]|uniref:ATP-dependent RecD2 DNA helicase n=1 Tax=Streptococcus ovuberis TaxID=1936207 RepID=A0A7X6MW94_9STRE|nr:ATP-dependent RecD-like DNA helicase [Streptococcus ovuberis]NKZ19572.1 ATP-dependent RecD-like DNA helicase [Streptococcus ovuberis]
MTYFFSGSIERVIFENPSNFYKIILLTIEETDCPDFDDLEIIVTGTVAEVIEGEDYTFFGELITHPRYGQQLAISRYERAKPSAKGLVNYFSSDHFKGIGRKTAERIVDTYGPEETIDQILKAPEKLTNIQGLSQKARENFLEKLRANYGTEMILAKLAEYGIPNKLAFQIQDTYKESTLQVIEENPYQLVSDIHGIGFKLADRIAENLNIASDAPERFRAGLLHSLLQRSMETGDTYVEARDLLEASLLLLEESRPVELFPEAVAAELRHLIETGSVQQVGTKIFNNSLYFSEEGIQKHLNRLLKQGPPQTFAPETIRAELAELEQQFGIQYDSLQASAIIEAINQPVFVLTGGPGTGKTTIINGLIAVYARLHGIDLTRSTGDLPIMLAAPTGRAARRMNELTGLPAATIHRHLGLTGESAEEVSYLSDYLDAELLIVDEFSMVDTWLANQLLTHVSPNTQLILVGDSDQLPSVNPGQVLADLLKVKTIPHIALKTIYRQTQDSTIVSLANDIRQGQLPPDFRDKKADRSYFEALPEQIPQMVSRIVSAAIKSGIPSRDIQILAPMYKGTAGIDQLNLLMQEQLNPLANEQLSFAFNDLSFRQGDKVIHLVNDAEANVFNGDLGYITDLLPGKYSDSKQDEISISFDGNEITYPRNEWYKITLAYAMSIHKSQGSEFPVVILPLVNANRRMLQRNLLYTAITRSKSKLILLGNYTAFDYATQTRGTARKTYLIERFEPFEPVEGQHQQENTPVSITEDHPVSTKQEQVEVPDQVLTEPTEYRLTPDNYLAIDTMIGLDEELIAQFFKS